jgi:hypothetical protein
MNFPQFLLLSHLKIAKIIEFVNVTMDDLLPKSYGPTKQGFVVVYITGDTT